MKLFITAAPCRFALTLLAFIVDIAFTLSLGGLLGMHARMLWLNVTTIEMFEKQRVTQWPFDRGPRRNFQEVFGSRCVEGSSYSQFQGTNCTQQRSGTAETRVVAHAVPL